MFRYGWFFFFGLFAARLFDHTSNHTVISYTLNPEPLTCLPIITPNQLTQYSVTNHPYINPPYRKLTPPLRFAATFTGSFTI
jgi:hypothetical protein